MIVPAELIVMRGLPGSGKSAWARERVARRPGSVAVVSRDTIREHVLGVRFDPQLEELVTRLQVCLIRRLLTDGLMVIVDDTNIKQEYVDRWRMLASELGVGFSVTAVDTPVEVCIARDAKRERPVGEKVIRRMASGWDPIYHWGDKS